MFSVVDWLVFNCLLLFVLVFRWSVWLDLYFNSVDCWIGYCFNLFSITCRFDDLVAVVLLVVVFEF